MTKRQIADPRSHQISLKLKIDCEVCNLDINIDYKYRFLSVVFNIIILNN
jgi:hypothetical protein